MNSIELLKKFGFKVEHEMKSIYPFAPVYKVDNYIVKKTQSPYELAINLVNYVEYLGKQQVSIVTPVKLNEDNPKRVGEEYYVCYPFIEGITYSAREAEIYQAGKLLGSIHALSTDNNDFDLEAYNVFDFYHHEVDEYMERIDRFVTLYRVDIDTDKLRSILHESIDHQSSLQQANLAWVETPHDYKANNLIYQQHPVLIDPDNAKWIPRIFDISLALLLFHNELDSAPDRIFTPEEWQIFLNGYKKYQQFTLEEINYWKIAVKHVFLDEVMWLMAEVEEDWGRQSQRDLFVSITKLLDKMDQYSIY
ncbi:phosphotransferase [Oceanobacillus sp. 1P07AA]|uniref:phosphotransferase n=1 Tax=Oceanobacillus sp. 1P07AA TaxID=3132293 RepID=UPI0039A4BF18